jgi:hypothetical protein
MILFLSNSTYGCEINLAMDEQMGRSECAWSVATNRYVLRYLR